MRRAAIALAVSLSFGSFAYAASVQAPSQAPSAAASSSEATERTIGSIETVATFSGPMPTGVTVTETGRIFVNFPRWGDDVQATVAEVR
ncbi:gluconolaconase, partial [Paraburkholderia sp. SIMBA_055]